MRRGYDVSLQYMALGSPMDLAISMASVAAQATHINMAPSVIMVHRYQHGFTCSTDQGILHGL